MQAKVLLTGILMVVLLSACASSADEGLSPEQAARHVGETATVCGRIASSHYAETGDGQPTFVNLDKSYPEQVFTIVIFGDYRAKFVPPPEAWTGHLCVTGKITSYRGKPEMKVVDSSQVRR